MKGNRCDICNSLIRILEFLEQVLSEFTDTRSGPRKPVKTNLREMNGKKREVR